MTVSRHLYGDYLQYALLHQIAARNGRHATPAEVAGELAALRSTLDNRGVSRVWPPLLSGIRSCDQINGAAAELLAHEFDEAEIVGIVDPKTGISPHTIGRYRTGGAWIWFDCFFGRVDLFRLVAGGLQPIASVQIPGMEGQRPDQIADSCYRLVAGGHWFVLRRYGGTLPSSIWFAFVDHLRSRQRGGRQMHGESPRTSPIHPGSSIRALEPEAMRRFLDARYDLLMRIRRSEPRGARGAPGSSGGHSN